MSTLTSKSAVNVYHLLLYRVVRDSNTKRLSIASTVLKVQAKVCTCLRNVHSTVIGVTMITVTGWRWCCVSLPCPSPAELLLSHHWQRQTSCHNMVPYMAIKQALQPHHLLFSCCYRKCTKNSVLLTRMSVFLSWYQCVLMLHYLVLRTWGRWRG